eukprot:532878_1
MVYLDIWIVSFLIHFMNTQQYFTTNQDYLEYANPYVNTDPKTIKVAYPINECTRTGHHMTASGASHGIYQCSAGGSVIIGPCKTNEAECLAKTIACDPNFPGVSWYSDFSRGESCQPDLRATTSINYMAITFYCGWTTDTRPNTCPSDDTLFFHRGITKFSTNICVDQGTGEYFMATCDSETGEIGIYDSASCNNKIGTYRQYTRSCDNYASPDPAFDSCNYFRRVTTCMVNGVNILAPTTKPSSAQTKDPSDSPSNDPTQIPTSQPRNIDTINNALCNNLADNIGLRYDESLSDCVGWCTNRYDCKMFNYFEYFKSVSDSRCYIFDTLCD